MRNFGDILHCMDFLMSEYSIPGPSQELFLEWGVTEVQMTHMSQPLMTQQWLSSSNGWGHPQRVRNGQKPCEKNDAATAQKMGCYQTRWAKLIQLIQLGQGSPFPPAFHWVLGIHHSRCCQKSSTFFATNAPVTTSPGQTSCLELRVFAAQIIEPCCVTVDLLATSQKNGGLLICFPRGWCRTIIWMRSSSRWCSGGAQELHHHFSGKTNKNHIRVGCIYMSRMKQNSTVFNQKFSEEFTRCLIGMGIEFEGFFPGSLVWTMFFFSWVWKFLVIFWWYLVVVSGAIGLPKLIPSFQSEVDHPKVTRKFDSPQKVVFSVDFPWQFVGQNGVMILPYSGRYQTSMETKCAFMSWCVWKFQEMYSCFGWQSFFVHEK